MTTIPWQLTIPPSPGSPIISDGSGCPIATVHGPREQATVDAVLFLNAPALLEAAQQSLEAFSIIAEHDEGPCSEVAAHLRDRLAALLRGPAGLWTDGNRAR